MSAQMAGMNYGPQMHHYASQAYTSNMTMHMPVQRAQAYPSGMAPQYYYNGYSVPVSQAPMQRQGQPMAGYSAMSYNRSEINNQANHSASYLSTLVLRDHSYRDEALAICSIVFDRVL
jgi:predicted heme/steroid binding protein